MKVENPLNQKAIDAAERQAHQINDAIEKRWPTCSKCGDTGLVKSTSGRLCPCLCIEWPTREQAPPEFLIVAHIKNGMKPDGTFRAESCDGAQIMLHMNLSDELVLSVDDDDGKMRTWVIK